MSERNSPPLVMHVIHHLLIGGMENGIVNLINNMPESKYRHVIVCIEDFSDFRYRIKRKDVDVIALFRSKIGVWRLRWKLFRLCRTLKPAIVHSRNQSGLDALLPARLAGCYCVHGEHGRDVDDLAGKGRKPALLRRLHRPLVHRYITVSNDLAKYLRGRIRVSAESITQIYNGVDMGKFSSLGRDGKSATNNIVIGTVGRLQAVKNQALLIRAFAVLLKEFGKNSHGLKLMIVGDGAYYDTLLELASSLGIAGHITFSGATDDVASALGQFDIFVLPSLDEGISNTILEAMSTGLPVVATAVGGNTELVVNEETGYLVPSDNPQAMADALKKYTDDKKTRLAHGKAGRLRVEEHFSLQRMVARYLEVYDTCLA